MMSDELNEKQKIFCMEYIKDLNATQAAIRAGYSEKAAGEHASRLLRDVRVSGYVDSLKRARSEECRIDAKWLLKRLAMIADFNINKFLTVGSNGLAYYDFSNATDDDWYCISEYTSDQINKGSAQEPVEVDRVRLKTMDRMKALEMIGKHIDVKAFDGAADVDEDAQRVNVTFEVREPVKDVRVTKGDGE